MSVSKSYLVMLCQDLGKSFPLSQTPNGQKFSCLETGNSPFKAIWHVFPNEWTKSLLDVYSLSEHIYFEYQWVELKGFQWEQGLKINCCSAISLKTTYLSLYLKKSHSLCLPLGGVA